MKKPDPAKREKPIAVLGVLVEVTVTPVSQEEARDLEADARRRLRDQLHERAYRERN